MTTHLLVVMTNAVEGREAEFDEWYSGRHLRDVVGLEGYEAAQRFRFEDTDPAGGEAPRYRHMALYEVPEDRVEAARASLAGARAERAEAEAAGREPEVPVSDAMQEDRVAYWFAEHSDRITAP